MNETSSGWQRHYEILWEDESPEGVEWIEQEFDFLWNAARPLPEAVIREVKRRGYRREVVFDEITEDDDLAPAALVESPFIDRGNHFNHGSKVSLQNVFATTTIMGLLGFYWRTRLV